MPAAILLASLTIGAVPLTAAPVRHRPAPAAALRCGDLHRLQTAYSAGEPACCGDALSCAEFLSTTTIVRSKAPRRT